jgi:hypothetical protein
VLTETLRLIAFNNQQVLEGNSAAVPWYVDAFSGASAGSITAAIAARVLADNKPLVTPRNPQPVQPGELLRQLWVEDISLDLLLAHPPNNTLLDSGAVSTLTANHFAEAPQHATRHPAIRPEPENAEIRLALSLSALDPNLQHTETLNGYPLDYHEYAHKVVFPDKRSRRRCAHI